MKDLFGNQIAILEGGEKQKADRIAIHQYKQLISIYGKNDGKRCKACVFAERHRAGSKSFYKCAKAKQSSSLATDWNSTWAACGLFKQS